MPYKDYEKTKANARSNYYKNKKRKLKQVSDYYYANWEKKQTQRKEWFDANKEKVREYRRDYYKNRYARFKRAASEQVCHKLKRPDRCSLCGKVCRVHGHHRDYSKPLEVIWLCPQCHKNEHGRMKCLKK